MFFYEYNDDQLFASTDYTYYKLVMGPLETRYFGGKKKRTLYCAKGRFSCAGIAVSEGDTIDASGINYLILSTYDSEIFVAESYSEDTVEVTLTKMGEHYNVKKPWGQEIWLTGKEAPHYCFKIIDINAGHRTSLQYHQIKEETIYIYSGDGRLVYKFNDDVNNDDVTESDLYTQHITQYMYLHFPPGELHRMCPISDMRLLEVSTPYLDDVIRVMDDTNRVDGHIQGEHS